MIKKKVFKISKLNLVWDWFELTKYLALLAGFFSGLSIYGLFKMLALEGKSKALMIGLTVVSMFLVFVLGNMINIIRSQHEDNELEIKIK